LKFSFIYQTGSMYYKKIELDTQPIRYVCDHHLFGMREKLHVFVNCVF